MNYYGVDMIKPQPQKEAVTETHKAINDLILHCAFGQSKGEKMTTATAATTTAKKAIMEEHTVALFTFRESRIPRHMVKAVLAYFNHKCPPGGFLRAVLENDLMQATRKADDENLECLHVYPAFFHNKAPDRSYGSKKLVQAWLDSRTEDDEAEAEAEADNE